MTPKTDTWPSQKRPAYAGIGSRETPPGVLDLMGRAASQLASEGWVLRTGMAGGADQAFYRGASAHGALELYLPWTSFEADACSPAGAAEQFVLGQPTPAAYELAVRFHPAWSRLGRVCAVCTRATAIRCSAPIWRARRASCCAGRLTAASMAVAGASAGPARRFGSPTTTAFRSSTSLAPSTPSACPATAPVRLADTRG
jgi:hypothetical protein